MEKNQREERQNMTKSNDDILITPQKVDKLEADEYLLEKAIKAQENALQKVMRVKRLQALHAKQRQHNEVVRRRKQERQNKRRARK